MDAIAKTFEALLETAGDGLALTLIEVSLAEVLVWMLVDQQVVDDPENAVRNGHHPLFGTTACRQRNCAARYVFVRVAECAASTRAPRTQRLP
jgi:hypothetical protein